VSDIGAVGRVANFSNAQRLHHFVDMLLLCCGRHVVHVS
jgi:hypothetical protein